MKATTTTLQPAGVPIPAAIAKEPLVVIDAKAATELDLGGLWPYRELLYFLSWRDVKVRYKQTALGAAWAILQPLMTMLVFTVLFGRLAKMPASGDAPYALFAYAGLLPWNFFSNAVTTSGSSLVASANLISKVYFPRVIIPASAVLSGLVDFVVAFAFFIVLMIFYGYSPTWNLLLMPVMLIIATLLSIAVGLFCSALNVRYRDVRYAIPFLLQIGMFATPIIYPPHLVPDKWRWALMLNPMAGVVDGFRASLLGTPIDARGVLLTTLYTLVLLVAGAAYFKRVEHSFADVV